MIPRYLPFQREVQFWLHLGVTRNADAETPTCSYHSKLLFNTSQRHTKFGIHYSFELRFHVSIFYEHIQDKKNHAQVSTVVWWLLCLALASHMASIWILFAQCCWKNQWTMAQVLGPVSTWQTCRKLLAIGFKTT